MQGITDLVDHDAQSASALAAQSGFTAAAAVSSDMQLVIERREAELAKELKIVDRYLKI